MNEKKQNNDRSYRELRILKPAEVREAYPSFS
jgi:hypothetical protein